MSIHRKFLSFILCIILLYAWPAFADYYAVTDMTWAEFYAGEIGDSATNLLSEGLDAVSTPTIAAAGSRKLFPQLSFDLHSSDKYSTKNETLIYGVKAVHVRMSDSVYELMKDNARFKFVDSEFDEYKNVNPDGSFGAMVSKKKTDTSAKVNLSSGASATWGNYVLNISGLDITIGSGDTRYWLGALVETTDGKIYGMRHDTNLWRTPDDIALSIKDFTEPHGVTRDGKYTSDLAGKTIKKITYLISGDEDIILDNLNLFVKNQTSATVKAVYESGFNAIEMGSPIKFEFANLPDGVNYNISSIYTGTRRDRKYITDYTYSNNVLTLTGQVPAGNYTVIFTTDNYIDISANFEIFTTDATDKIISLDNNAGAVNFLLTPSGACDSVDNFLKVSNFVNASDYTSPDKNFSVIYSGGENQVKDSGFSFDITLNNVPADKIGVVGFGKIFYLTPENCGSMYEALIYPAINSLETYPSGYKGIFGSMFREMGLKIWSVLDDGTLRDVTDYVGAGAMISDDNNIMLYYGVMLADRAITSNDEGNTYPFSPEGETLLSDGRHDSHLKAAYYFEVLDEDAKVIKDSDNQAGISFEVMRPGFFAEADNSANEKKLTWIYGNMAKSAITEKISGYNNQLTGDSGFSFSVEVDSNSVPAGYTPIIGFSKIFEFNESNLGTEDFNTLKNRVNELVANSPTFYTSDYTALTDSGIRVMAAYPDLNISDKDITDSMQFGLFISGDSVLMSYGAVAVDREITNNEGELLNIGVEKSPLMSDGLNDGIIKSSWYITHTSSNNNLGFVGGSSGCNSFTGSIILLGLVLTLKKLRK